MRTSPWFVAGLGCVFVFGFAVLAVSLFRLQTREAGDYAEKAVLQATRRVRVPALRGRILDRAGRVLADCRPSRCICCFPEAFARGGGRSNTVDAVAATIAETAAALGLDNPVSRQDVARHVAYRSVLPLTVWRDVDERVAARFAERSHLFPGFEIEVQAERTYPYGTLAAHVLGYTGRGTPGGDIRADAPVTGARAAHFDASPEMCGRRGVEAFYNRYLAGFPGEEVLAVDARGFRPRRPVGGVASVDGTAPADGMDLELTIDVPVQQALERQLEGLTGAGVVLDARDGAVLAMASAPTFDPNDCVPRLSHETYASLTNAPAKRGQNRAVSESYAPGSTFKPLTALAALATGWLADDVYDCTGVYRLGEWRLHCANRWGHGPLGLFRAMEQSCNTYFCNLGTAIGTNALISAARAFGLGEKTGIDLDGETPGVVPDDAWKFANFRERWYPGDTCQMSIGQGMLLVTPLQMAVAAAALANGGTVVKPYLHKRPAGTVAPEGRRVPYRAEDIETVRRGMRAVAETGTGRAVGRGLPVSCAAKTGTAEVGRGATRRKNTWVIAFAPYDDPTVAVAMLVERGESGGKTVAPRVREVLAAIFGEEGGAG